MDAPETVIASVMGTMLHAVVRPFVKGKVLDVGCGNKPYKRLFDNEWTGLDNRAVGEIQADAAEMPIEPDSYDTVVCSDLLNYVPSPAHVVAECLRVLKPGGYAAFLVRNTSPDDGVMLWKFPSRGLDFLLSTSGYEDVRLMSDGALIGAEWQSITTFEKYQFLLPSDIQGWIDLMNSRYPAVSLAIGRKPERHTILDIGAGIRPQTIIPGDITVLEPHGEYRDWLAENRPDVTVVEGEWKDAMRLFPPESFDHITLLDVIEHLDKDEAKRLIAETLPLARKSVVVFTPNGFHEQAPAEDGTDAWGMHGGEWQRHRSGWSPEDFEGWQVRTENDRLWAVWTRG